MRAQAIIYISTLNVLSNANSPFSHAGLHRVRGEHEGDEHEPVRRYLFMP